MAEEPTVIIDVGKLVKNARGEPVPDMLDPPVGLDRKDAPQLTLGSLIANSLYLGITGSSNKDSFKYFQIAGKVEDALKPVNEGKLTLDRAALDQLEEAWGKINVPVFTLPVYSGLVQNAINDAKVEMLAKEKESKSKDPKAETQTN